MAKIKSKKVNQMRGGIAGVLKSHQDGLLTTEEAIEEIINLIFSIIASGRSIVGFVRSLIAIVKKLF
jgi:hypothetical protein